MHEQGRWALLPVVWLVARTLGTDRRVVEGLFMMILAHWASGKAVVCMTEYVRVAARSQEPVGEVHVALSHESGMLLGWSVWVVWLRFSLEQGCIFWLWQLLLCVKGFRFGFDLPACVLLSCGLLFGFDGLCLGRAAVAGRTRVVIDLALQSRKSHTGGMAV